MNKDIQDTLVPVLLGGDIFTYSCVRSFYDAYQVKSIVLSTANIKFVSTSRFCDYRVIPDIDQTETLLVYLEQLGKSLVAQNKTPLLLGTGDYYARLFSQHKEYLSQWFVVPYIDFDLLDDITQKERFYELCEELNVAYPKTWRLDCSVENQDLDMSEMDFPVIAKPSNSAEYHYAEFPGKKKVFEVETPQELKRIYTALQASSYSKELIVQDFIPGDDDALYSITTFTDEVGDTEVVCAGRVVLQDHAPSALGNPVCIIDAWPKQAIDDAKRFLKYVGYRGFANFDVKFDCRDNTYKFFEVNTRPGRNTYYMCLAGVNFVTLLVEEFILGKKHTYTEARNKFCYACIPAYVVKKTVKDESLRTDVLARYASRLTTSPLCNSKDTLAQRFWAAVNYYNQIPKFKKYVWETGGKQVDVS